jgi:hypothetical protein
MNEQDIRAQVVSMAKLFNLPPCAVRVEPRLAYGKWGFYSLYGATIMFRASILSELTPSMVAHEFAHHLAAVRKADQTRCKRARKTVKLYTKRLRAWDFGWEQEQKALARHRKAIANMRQVRRPRHEWHGDDFVASLQQIIKRTGMEYDTSREYITVARKLKGGR